MHAALYKASIAMNGTTITAHDATACLSYHSQNEVHAHGYTTSSYSHKHVAGDPAVYSLPKNEGRFNDARWIKLLDSRHDLNVALPPNAKTPQTSVEWEGNALRLGNGAQFVKFYCAPLRIDGRRFMHDPMVFVRYFNGNYVQFFVTNTPIGPRFWSRLFARESAIMRAHPIDTIMAPLDVRHGVTTYRWLIQSMAASVLQRFATGIAWRWLRRRAARRQLLKRALRMPVCNDHELLWRLKATPEIISALVLAYI